VHRSVHNFSTFNCGNVYGFYNNFFATRVGFWMRDDVQDFLRHADQSHHIYVHRWNDILWQSAAVQIFLPPNRVEMNRDFAYEHVTFGKINITVQLSSEMHDKNDSSSSTGSSRGKKRSAVTTKVSTRCITYGGLVLGERGNQSAAMARERFWLALSPTRERTVAIGNRGPFTVRATRPLATILCHHSRHKTLLQEQKYLRSRVSRRSFGCIQP